MTNETTWWNKQTVKYPGKWKLACVRCGIYALMVGWGAFQVGVQGYETLEQMSVLQRVFLAGGVVSAMLGVWLAFLDQTLTAPSSDAKSPPNNQPSVPISAPGNSTR